MFQAVVEQIRCADNNWSRAPRSGWTLIVAPVGDVDFHIGAFECQRFRGSPSGYETPGFVSQLRITARGASPAC